MGAIVAGARLAMGATKADLRRRLGAVIAALAAFAVLLGLVAIAGAAFSAPVSLSAPGFSINPEIASDADGGAVAVWSRFDGSTYRVQARTISAAGVLGPTQTLSAAGQYGNDPQIASDADGGAVAVWWGDSGVQARTISAAGVLGPTKTLSAYGAEPQIASDADGDAVAVWSGDSGVEARTISAAGVLGPTQTLSAAGVDVRDPEIASDADGAAVAVWERLNSSRIFRVQARTISAAGVLGPIKTLSTAGQWAINPEIASDADGAAVAVWFRFDGSNYRVQARTISAAGVLGATKNLSAAGQNAVSPQVASDADGAAVAVWHRGAVGGATIQARTISAAGVLGPTRTLSGGTAQKNSNPQIASDADGGAVAVWSRSDGSNYRVQARTISAASVLGATQTLSAAGQAAGVGSIASDADGDAVAIWARSEDSGNRIQASQGP